MALKYVQSQTLYQAGSGSLIGATTVTLTSLTDIYGNVLTIADFGAKGFFTCEPDTTNEESGTFTGITANANGTYTLTGVSTSLGKSPYTETSGMVRLHSGGTSVVLTDNVAFWNTFANKQNDEVITGRWSSATVPSTANDYTNKNYVDGVAIAGAPDASTTVKGVSRLTQSPNRTLGVVTVTIATPAVATFTAHGLTLNDTIQFTTTGALPTGITASTNYFVIAAGFTANTFQIATTLGGTAINTSGSQSGVHTLIRTTPYVIADTDYRMLTNSFGVDSGTANAHVVTLPYTSPSVLISGTLVSYIALNTNTLATTANVAGTGVKTIKKLAGTTDIAPGDIVAGMVVELEYSATSGFWQMLNPVANAPLTLATDIQIFSTASTTSWTKPAGAKRVEVYAFGAGGGGGASGQVSAGNAGGGGGGGGGFGKRTYVATSLASSETVVVGAGGAGGTGIIGAGVVGGFSSFSSGSLILKSGGGGGAITGSGAGTGGVSNGEINQQGGNGGNGGVNSGAAGAAVDSASNISPRGGGGSGTGSTIGGGFITNYVLAGGALNTAGATTATNLLYGGVGAGGGSGQNGKIGGSIGGGGSGGGPDNTGTFNGGAGGDGMVVVITYF